MKPDRLPDLNTEDTELLRKNFLLTSNSYFKGSLFFEGIYLIIDIQYKDLTHQTKNEDDMFTLFPRDFYSESALIVSRKEFEDVF